MIPRRLDLTAILSQNRIDEIKPQLLVDSFLVGAGNNRIPIKKAVLIKLELGLLRHLPQANIMGLGAGEILGRGPEAFRRHHPHIHLHGGRIRPDDSRAFRLSGPQNALHKRRFRKGSDQLVCSDAVRRFL